MKVFIDTGVFLSISDKSDAFNKLVSSVYKKVAEQNAVLYTSNYIIDETITLIRARVNHKAAVAFIKGFNISNIRMLRIAEGDENSAKEIFIKYKDKNFSYTDCTSFALIDKHSIDSILSLDEHFNQYAYKHTVKHLLSKLTL